jgi:MFS family permease
MKSLKRLARHGLMEDRATRRVVLALSLSAFAEWGGASAVLPLLPVYLRHEGSSVTLVGLTMASFFAAALLVQYPLGRLSDRIGRRSIQIGGLITYSIATILFIFVSAPLAALLFRGLQGAGVGVVDVGNAAAISEAVPESQRGRAFGALYGMRTAGMAIAPFFGSILGLRGMHWIFFGAAVVVLIAALPIVFFTPRYERREPLRPHERTVLWRNRSVLGVAAAFLAGGIVVGMYEVCWSLLLTLRGAHPWQIGLSWTLFALPFALMSMPAGWLVDHMDRRHLTVLSLVGTAAFAATYPWLHSVALLVGLGAGEACAVALGGPAESAQLTRSVRAGEVGRAQGAVFSAQTGAMAVSASVAGVLFGVRPWLPFMIAAGAIMVCVGAVGLVWRGVPGRGSAIPEPVASAGLSAAGDAALGEAVASEGGVSEPAVQRAPSALERAG